jgi:BirA family biotin operon repressor/biotin-[acetyl-CoA-carboxylase] ligase
MKRILLPVVPSTNDYALELLHSERPEEGTVIQAQSQTQGRGQRGARWEAEPGRNLTVSVILYPTFLDPQRQFELSKAMALAVAGCVASLTGLRPSIKWPNDILLAGRKVAGLLIENRLLAARMDASVVGIGLNVNQAFFPPHLEGAGSLLGVTGHELDLEQALARLHAAVLERYGELRADSTATDKDYLSLLHGRGQERGFAAGDRSFRGAIEGVDQEGRLLVREAGGTLHAYGAKEIAFDNPADLT